ncbi:hypothetical protein PQI07_22475 [Methylobacterium sp. 092160098-2]|uniref:hypothetical protein n=1 Tax=Methylobacterium sp. 092160098-2 TaxID=3025129 RepID=UPI002381B4C7|nr:hypothetical protein [Methylobacterium sp. 092160098-2]MDE4913449.1 hypothetical protein [Methylobacterium sp. 092160098-2]
MNICKIIAALALLFQAGPALAQATNTWPRMIPVRPDGSVIDPGSVGGGVGGSVTQGTTPWVISGNSTANASGNPIFTQVVNFPASQAVTNAGTFAVQNTAATPAGANVIGRVGIDQTTPGTTNAVVAQGQYTTTPPTLSNNAYAAPQLDANGRVLVSIGQTLAAGGTSPGLANSIQGITNGVPVPMSAASLPLPAGAATAANQATEITALQTAALRAVPFSEASAAAAASGATIFGGSRDAGAASPWSKFNALVSSNQSGTLVVQGSNDNFTTGVIIGSTAITANVSAYITVPLLYRYNRAYLVNGATAATYSMNTSYTAN